jgi:hypothetical protein
MNARRFTADASRAFDRKDSTRQPRQETAALRDINPGYDRLGYNAGSVERLVALTDEQADFSREFSSSFPLRGLVHSGETSGQRLFDGVVRRFESAQLQFGCQIVHRYFTGSILASKPVLDCGNPAFA